MISKDGNTFHSWFALEFLRQWRYSPIVFIFANAFMGGGGDLQPVFGRVDGIQCWGFYLIRQQLKNFPKECMEAAALDGAEA